MDIAVNVSKCMQMLLVRNVLKCRRNLWNRGRNIDLRYAPIFFQLFPRAKNMSLCRFSPNLGTKGTKAGIERERGCSSFFD